MPNLRIVYQGDTFVIYDVNTGRNRWALASGAVFPVNAPGSGFPRPHDGALFFRHDLDSWYTWDEASGAWVISGVGGGPHATSHQDGGTDEISVAGLSGLLADPQTPAAHTHAEADVTGLVADLAAKVPTTRTLSTTAPLTGGGDLSADRTFGVNDFVASGAGHARGTVPDPGAGAGTTKFLREDASWQVPPAGGSTPSGTGFRHVTAGVEDGASKLVNLTAASDVAANQGTTTTLLHGNAAGQASFGAVVTADISDNQVTPAKLDDGSGFSVLGKATTGSGDRADIVAGDETVLGRTAAGNVAFAALATGQIAAKAVTYAKIQDVSATDRLLGRDTAGAGVVEEITVAAALTMLGAYSGVTLQAFTTTGANTYTPTSGMKHCVVISTGAGGGGGGADVTGAADTAAGAGGGAGGTAIEAFSAATIGASQTVTIGAGGTAGNNTGGNGGNGADTTFGALHTGVGGTGGTGSGAASTVNTRTVAGGAGGTPTGGLANIIGGAGFNGWAMQTTDATDTNETSIAMGGQGGGSFWGSGGRGGQNAQDAAAADSTAGSEAGQDGAAKGSGGGGGAVQNTATGVAGGVGANGFCLVIEFT